MKETQKAGRPHKYKTKEEAREAAKKYQRDYKRERYRSDPAYREKITRGARESYHKKKGTHIRLGANAGNAAAFSRTRKGYLTLDEMKEFIGGPVSSWVAAGKFPRPQRELKTGQRVYTVGQANKLARVVKERMKGRVSLCATDTATIMVLFATI